jgi:hypothetical protein
LTARPVAPILTRMWWTRYLERIARVEHALVRLRERLLPPVPITAVGESADATAAEDLRLFPIVGRDLCYPVAALLARGKLEEAGRLVPDRAWVASAPLYG